eukprot:NODE_1204_length_1644_cov_41.547335_g1069_i0.p1 GENE.NODE_1204_length_1644_cov_41.547335_g1069_i0~~NODE_1204_length_1644_cov_41.547335_g1069_i0.p1  ORF type:complete len:427 (-),score=69.95 NODE_1204_length_1644_cov_41.547335_g1069_i0:284-1564(-)
MSECPGFREVPRTGVIYVMDKAAEFGFSSASNEWANLGQGSPETGFIDNSPERATEVTITEENSHYAPVGGYRPLREAVANLYNALYRKDKASKYTFENVCICPGGRAGLTRLVAAMAPVNLGHFIPDYTAYQELLTIFRAFNPIPILCDPDNSFKIGISDLRREIVGRGLSALLASNPSNPTGAVVDGSDLSQWVKMARECQCSFIIDEVYSHYVYPHPNTLGTAQSGRLVSAAQFVEDVNSDPIVILDGLTKGWRLPGWRCCWVVAPKPVIDSITSSGTFLDGGVCAAFQHAAIPLLKPEFVIADTLAVQSHFTAKRTYVLDRLSTMDLRPDVDPAGTFYVWTSLSSLPAPYNDGDRFFSECLKEQVITVPGRFFDVNPGNRRSNSRYTNYIRISYGPPMAELRRGLDGIERVVQRIKLGGSKL